MEIEGRGEVHMGMNFSFSVFPFASIHMLACVLWNVFFLVVLLAHIIFSFCASGIRHKWIFSCSGSGGNPLQWSRESIRHRMQLLYLSGSGTSKSSNFNFQPPTTFLFCKAPFLFHGYWSFYGMEMIRGYFNDMRQKQLIAN